MGLFQAPQCSFTHEGRRIKRRRARVGVTSDPGLELRPTLICLRKTVRGSRGGFLFHHLRFCSASQTPAGSPEFNHFWVKLVANHSRAGLCGAHVHNSLTHVHNPLTRFRPTAGSDALGRSDTGGKLDGKETGTRESGKIKRASVSISNQAWSSLHIFN